MKLCEILFRETITMKKPKMILFDYGQTLVNEQRFNGVRGTEAVLKYATKNKYGKVGNNG